MPFTTIPFASIFPKKPVGFANCDIL